MGWARGNRDPHQQARLSARNVTLTITLWALAGGALVLAPSLLYLFRVFKTAPAAQE